MPYFMISYKNKELLCLLNFACLEKLEIEKNRELLCLFNFVTLISV